MDSIEDFHKKYHQTWVQYVGKDKISPAIIELVSFDEDMVFLRSQDEGLVSVQYSENSFANKLDLSPPQTGFFNYNGHALVLFRTPARQWRRGLCNENHEIYNPFKKLLHEGAYCPSFGSKTIVALFSPSFVCNPDEARAMFSNSIHSVALSRRLAISKSPIEQSSYPLIWFGCNPCGFVRGQKFVVEDETFQQEVEDELRSLGKDEWIF